MENFRSTELVESRMTDTTEYFYCTSIVGQGLRAPFGTTPEAVYNTMAQLGYPEYLLKGGWLKIVKVAVTPVASKENDGNSGATE